MKDAYSFDLDDAGMARSYEIMSAAYERIFTRLGLAFCRVAADSGSIGGETSHEFHILAESGEDHVVLSESGAYAASLDLAETPRPDAQCPPPAEPMRLADTPGITTIAGLVEKFELPVTRTIKTLIVQAKAKTDANPHGLAALLLRGDHQLNPLKAERLPEVAKPLTMADEAAIFAAIGARPGSLGPVDMPLPMAADHSVAVMADFAAGANQEGKHYFGINWQRDVPLPACADLRNITEQDRAPDGSALRIARAIEIGHVFQLGRKYSEPLGATVLNEHGETAALAMGCYGIGITRLAAATIEQHHDDKGIIWPESTAPFQAALLAVGMHQKPEVREAAQRLYGELKEAGFDVLFEDRDERPGVLFADQELIGIPHLLVLGARDLAKGVLEYRRRSGGKAETVPINETVQRLSAILRQAGNRNGG